MMRLHPVTCSILFLVFLCVPPCQSSDPVEPNGKAPSSIGDGLMLDDRDSPKKMLSLWRRILKNIQDNPKLQKVMDDHPDLKSLLQGPGLIDPVPKKLSLPSSPDLDGEPISKEDEENEPIGSQDALPEESIHQKSFHKVHRRKSDKVETKEEAKPGLFMVPDPSASLSGHKHPPSCIIAELNASLVIPIQDPQGNIHNKTIIVPNTAQVKGLCRQDQQTMTLLWNNTRDSGKLVKQGSLTMLFTKHDQENAVFLTHVWANVDLFLEDNPAKSLIDVDQPSQNVMMTVKEKELLRTPLRFSFVCHHRLEVRLHANTNPLQSDSGDDLIIDPIFNEEAFLVFHELHVEAFMKNRFSKRFTHLNYDCVRKFAYNYMPKVVGAALAALVLVVLLVRLNYRLSQKKLQH